jgi:hypothetical protein
MARDMREVRDQVQRAVAVASDAHDNDRPLLQTEVQQIRDALNDPDVASLDSEGLRNYGALRMLSDALTRDTARRMERDRVQAELERGQERARKVAARQEHWDAAKHNDPLRAALLVVAAETRDPALGALAAALGRPLPAEPPRNFEPEVLTEHERMFG